MPLSAYSSFFFIVKDNGHSDHNRDWLVSWDSKFKLKAQMRYLPLALVFVVAIVVVVSFNRGVSPRKSVFGCRAPIIGQLRIMREQTKTFTMLEAKTDGDTFQQSGHNKTISATLNALKLPRWQSVSSSNPPRTPKEEFIAAVLFSAALIVSAYILRAPFESIAAKLGDPNNSIHIRHHFWDWKQIKKP